MAGAVLYGATYKSVFPKLSKIGKVGEATVPSLLGVNPWPVVIAFSCAVLILFVVIERRRLG